jgi:hypothetical protein
VAAGRQLGDEGLAEHDGCSQVGLEVQVPGAAVGSGQAVEAEHRGVVDQKRQRPELVGGRGDDAGHLLLPGEVGTDDGGPAAQALKLVGQILRHGQRFVAMQCDVEAIVGQRARHHGAKPLGAASDQGRADEFGHHIHPRGSRAIRLPQHAGSGRRSLTANWRRQRGCV